jgi:uncharacterized phiE125 gp8 family phage protein
MINYVLDTAPASEWITLDQAKSFLRVPFDDDDDFIEETLIPACRQAVEKYLNRSLYTQTWKAHLTRFKNEIKLSKGKIQSITHIKYYKSNTLTTLDDTLYNFTASDNVCTVEAAFNTSFPVADYRLQAVEIKFVAGYGTTEAVIPKPITLGILQTISHYYNNRNPIAFGGTPIEIPKMAEFVLKPYRIARL